MRLMISPETGHYERNRTVVAHLTYIELLSQSSA